MEISNTQKASYARSCPIQLNAEPLVCRSSLNPKPNLPHKPHCHAMQPSSSNFLLSQRKTLTKTLSIRQTRRLNKLNQPSAPAINIGEVMRHDSPTTSGRPASEDSRLSLLPATNPLDITEIGASLPTPSPISSLIPRAILNLVPRIPFANLVVMIVERIIVVVV